MNTEGIFGADVWTLTRCWCSLHGGRYLLHQLWSNLSRLVSIGLMLDEPYCC